MWVVEGGTNKHFEKYTVNYLAFFGISLGCAMEREGDVKEGRVSTLRMN